MKQLNDIESLEERATKGDKKAYYEIAEYHANNGNWRLAVDNFKKYGLRTWDAAYETSRVLCQNSNFGKLHEYRIKCLEIMAEEESNGETAYEIARLYIEIGDSYSINKRTDAVKDEYEDQRRMSYERAVPYLRKSGDDGNIYADLTLVDMLVDGWAVPRDYKEAMYRLIRCACKGSIEAIVDLVKFYKEGKVTKIDYFEAYVWGRLSHGDIFPKTLDQIESHLDVDQVLQAQRESDKRKKNIDEGEWEELLEYLEGKSILSAKGSQKQLKIETDVSNKVKSWDVSEIGEVEIWINQIKKNVYIKYGNKSKSARLTFAEFISLFSKSEFKLLIEHDKHLRDNKERAIDYYGKYISKEFDNERENHAIVSDFNSHFRKLFGLKRSDKAFVWLPGIKGKCATKSLKANFTLKVSYLTE